MLNKRNSLFFTSLLFEKELTVRLSESVSEKKKKKVAVYMMCPLIPAFE